MIKYSILKPANTSRAYYKHICSRRKKKIIAISSTSRRNNNRKKHSRNSNQDSQTPPESLTIKLSKPTNTISHVGTPRRSPSSHVHAYSPSRFLSYSCFLLFPYFSPYFIIYSSSLILLISLFLLIPLFPFFLLIPLFFSLFPYSSYHSLILIVISLFPLIHLFFTLFSYFFLFILIPLSTSSI